MLHYLAHSRTSVFNRTFNRQTNFNSERFFVSGILIFERLGNQKKLHFIRAIMQCCSYPRPFLHSTTPSCFSLQDAVSIVESDPTLNQLKTLLVSHVKTYYSCYSCGRKPESLAFSRKRIFIFKTSEANRYTAYPILLHDDFKSDFSSQCSNCEFSAKNVEMEVASQIFFQLPESLMVSIVF